MLNEDFQYLLEEFGKPAKAHPVDAALLAEYQGKIPQSLLGFWEECGIGMWFKGKFQFCDPRRYKPVVATLLQSDPQFSPERTHMIGHSAFGELLLWNEDYQNIEVDLPFLWARAMATTPDWSPSDPDIAITSPLALLDGENRADFREESEGTPLMFARARKKLGELELGEVYGFVPALKLGGSARLENLQRVSALEHFAILAQLGPVQLFDYSTGDQQFVRMLGVQ